MPKRGCIRPFQGSHAHVKAKVTFFKIPFSSNIYPLGFWPRFGASSKSHFWGLPKTDNMEGKMWRIMTFQAKLGAKRSKWRNWPNVPEVCKKCLFETSCGLALSQIALMLKLRSGKLTVWHSCRLHACSSCGLARFAVWQDLRSGIPWFSTRKMAAILDRARQRATNAKP